MLSDVTVLYDYQKITPYMRTWLTGKKQYKHRWDAPRGEAWLNFSRMTPFDNLIYIVVRLREQRAKKRICFIALQTTQEADAADLKGL